MRPRLSFEFFPPRTDAAADRLRETAAALAAFAPEFVSVTYGAGGSTRERTLDTVLALRAAGHEAAPHLSCIGATRTDLAGMLGTFRDQGIRRIVALRGDLPSGTVGGGDFRHARDLVEFIRAQPGDPFRVAVACYPEVHPEARSPAADLAHFRDKIEAGADLAITQYFFNPDAYFRFVEDCAGAGIRVPVVPGIMPIGHFAQLARFSDACGAEIPRWLRLRLQACGDDTDAIRALGLDAVTALCERLLAGGAPGLHFYTLNQAGLPLEIVRRLGIGPGSPG